MPFTLNNFISGLQRGMDMEWGYELNLISGAIFSCPKERLMFVIDNYAILLQEERLHTYSRISCGYLKGILQNPTGSMHVGRNFCGCYNKLCQEH